MTWTHKFQIGSTLCTLRNECFDLHNAITGLNIFVDVDNVSRTSSTVFQVQKKQITVIKVINAWIFSHFNLKIPWLQIYH